MIDDYSKIDFDVPECVKELDPVYNYGRHWTCAHVAADSDGRKLDFIKPGMVAECYTSAPYYSSTNCTTVERVDDKGFYLTNGDYVLWEQIGRIVITKPSGKELGFAIHAKYGSRAFNSRIPADAREGLCGEFNSSIEFLTEKVNGTFREWELD